MTLSQSEWQHYMQYKTTSYKKKMHWILAVMLNNIDNWFDFYATFIKAIKIIFIDVKKKLEYWNCTDTARRILKNTQFHNNLTINRNSYTLVSFLRFSLRWFCSTHTLWSKQASSPDDEVESSSMLGDPQ